jgi:hypothetical protein
MDEQTKQILIISLMIVAIANIAFNSDGGPPVSRIQFRIYPSDLGAI